MILPMMKMKTALTPQTRSIQRTSVTGILAQIRIGVRKHTSLFQRQILILLVMKVKPAVTLQMRITQRTLIVGTLVRLHIGQEKQPPEKAYQMTIK